MKKPVVYHIGYRSNGTLDFRTLVSPNEADEIWERVDLAVSCGFLSFS